MKVFITETELNNIFKNILYNDLLLESLTDTDKSDIKNIVKKEIKDFLKINRSSELETKINKIVTDNINKNKELEKHIVEITKNVITQLYKTLWVRRNMWTTELKNIKN